MKKYEVNEKNSLKNEINELLKWCKKYDEDNDGEYTRFDEPISEVEMEKWELENSVKIPESYKEWLRFSKNSVITQNTARFWGPDKFNSDYVPEDYVVIGEMIGDGERICFSKKTGKFVDIFENKEKSYDSFAVIINEIISLLDNKPLLSDEEFFDILAKYEEMKNAGEIE